MRYAAWLAVPFLFCAWGQTVKPTPGALTPMTALGATPSAPGAIPKDASPREVFQTLESRFDYLLKTASRDNPMDVFGRTRGLYVQGYGAVFTTEVELAQSHVFGMFVQPTQADRIRLHDQKLKNVDVLRQQMRNVMAVFAKDLPGLAPTDHLVVAVRLLYQAWEDRTGLPEQIVMQADRNGALTGDVKVDVQTK